MDWLTKYWWVLVLVFLVGVMINVIKDLTRVDHKKLRRSKQFISDCSKDIARSTQRFRLRDR
ncbi:MAG: hypothetical protein E7J32_03620 [Klebsiella grimontii]|nr:hypothetical protein [Klebsiella grimontii]